MNIKSNFLYLNPVLPKVRNASFKGNEDRIQPRGTGEEFPIIDNSPELQESIEDFPIIKRPQRRRAKKMEVFPIISNKPQPSGNFIELPIKKEEQGNK